MIIRVPKPIMSYMDIVINIIHIIQTRITIRRHGGRQPRIESIITTKNLKDNYISPPRFNKTMVKMKLKEN